MCSLRERTDAAAKSVMMSELENIIAADSKDLYIPTSTILHQGFWEMRVSTRDTEAVCQEAHHLQD